MNNLIEESVKLNDGFAIQKKIKKEKWNKLLLFTGVLTTFGIAIPTGMNIGVINAPAEYMKVWANETIFYTYGVILSQSLVDVLWSIIVSAYLVGGVCSSLCGGLVADRFGRKGSYFICVLLFTLGAICFQLCRFVSSVELLIIGRILVGLASGLTTATLPMYLTEIAPVALRGTFGVFCSMGLTGGVVVGQIVSLQQVFGTNELWHYSLGSYIVLVFVCSLPYYWFPESPKYLLLVANSRDLAIKELSKLCGHDTEKVNKELESMQPLSLTASTFEKRGILSIIKDPTLLLPIILVCALQGGQQLSGINAVFYYSVSIFESIGLSSENAKWANLGSGCINLFVSFFSPHLMATVKRRPLSQLSIIGCSIFLVILTFTFRYKDFFSWLPYFCVIALFGYIIFYQLGLGPIPFFIGSELFEVGPRPAAMALGSLSSWGCNFLVAMTFPTLISYIESYVFLIFATVCIFLTILLKIYLPETKNKNSSEIALLVSNGFKSRPN